MTTSASEPAQPPHLSSLATSRAISLSPTRLVRRTLRVSGNHLAERDIQSQSGRGDRESCEGFRAPAVPDPPMRRQS